MNRARILRRTVAGVLGALLVLAVSGLLTLAVRDTAAFGPVLYVHLVAVTACFAIAPYRSLILEPVRPETLTTGCCGNASSSQSTAFIVE